MILSLYQEIGTELSEIEQLQWIDLDKGQLENPSAFESLLSPAVLIGFENGIEWQELARSKQTGIALVSIKIVVTLPQSTHIKPNTTDLNPNDLTSTLGIEDIVHNKFILNKGATRTFTKSYYSGSFYVTEHTYSIAYGYEPTPHYSTKHLTTKPSINAQITEPQ